MKTIDMLLAHFGGNPSRFLSWTNCKNFPRFRSEADRVSHGFCWLAQCVLKQIDGFGYAQSHLKTAFLFLFIFNPAIQNLARAKTHPEQTWAHVYPQENC